MAKLPLINKFIPTIGNLPASYDESLSYLQMLMLFKKNLNDTIDIVNQLVEFANNLDINFDDLYSKIDNINYQIGQINARFNMLETSINAQTDTKLNTFYYQILNLMQDYQAIFTNDIRLLREDLEAQIERIELGNIVAYDPTTR